MLFGGHDATSLTSIFQHEVLVNGFGEPGVDDSNAEPFFFKQGRSLH